MSRSKVVTARRWAHRTSVLLGDVRAVQRRRVGRRIGNRIIGRGIAKIARALWL